MPQKIKLFVRCPHCGGTGFFRETHESSPFYEDRICSDVYPDCYRGFVLVTPHVTFVIEDYEGRLQSIAPAGADITWDIINIDDDGVLDDDDENPLHRILDELFPGWLTLSWIIYVFEGLEARDFILDGYAMNRFDNNRLNGALYENDIDLTTWAVTEVRRGE